MKKAKYREIALIVFAWLLALALVCLIYMKAKILLNNK